MKFLSFHRSPLLSLVSDRFMNSSRKIPVVLVFVLGFGRAAPDNQWNGRGLFCFKVPFGRRRDMSSSYFPRYFTLWPLLSAFSDDSACLDDAR